MATKKQQRMVEIPEIKLERHKVWLIGTAPLIVHAFPEKARKQMLDKQMKVAKGGRDARDPMAEFEAARYKMENGHDGFPAVAFKSAAVTACTQLTDITKVAARQAFRIAGIPMKRPGIIEGSFVRTALVPIIAHPPMVREDVVRLQGPSRPAEMRYRPEYSEWAVELDLYLNPQVISFPQLCSMFQAAGHGVGVGDYRIEGKGDCGTFDIASEDTFREWCKSQNLQNGG